MSLKRTRDDADLASDSNAIIGSHILSCMNQAKHVFSSRIKMPWERQFIGPWDRASEVLSVAKPVKDLYMPVPSEETNRQHFDNHVRITAFRKAGIRLIRDCDQKLWADRLSNERKAAVRKWTSLVAEQPGAWDIAVRHFSNGEMTQVGQLADSVKDALATKASSTLHSRANPMFRFLTFCKEHGLTAFPILEANVYMFLKHQDFAPTFPRSFLISLAFSFHILGLRGDKGALTGRTKGVAHEWFLKKRKLLQRPPLSVNQVVFLEKLVMDESKHVRDRVAAGFFAFVLYSRARYSDALHVENLKSDIIDRGGCMYGFLEAESSRTKTSTTLERKTRFLPMTCPVNTVGGTRWVDMWMKLRCSEALEAGPNKPLLPAPADRGGWSNVPLTATSAGAWLRSLLEGSEGPPVSSLGTHSLKATVLSWAAKYGLDVPTRRALGYHQASSDISVQTYSRDAMAGPLRSMQKVLDAISEGEFLPDETRSGYFRSGSPANVVTGQPAEIPSSSESSADEEDHEFEKDEEAIDSCAGTWQSNMETPWMALAAVYFRHKTSRCIHVLQDEAGAEFMCGRRLSTAYTRLPKKPDFLHPICIACERAVIRAS